MAIDIERPAQHLAGINHRELSDIASRPEPAIPDQQRPRVVVETDRQLEAPLERGGERMPVEGRGKVDLHHHAGAGIDHASDGDANAERRPGCATERAGNGLADDLEDLGSQPPPALTPLLI
jgi:hypothetical protein